jgi:hypothetical protein
MKLVITFLISLFFANGCSDYKDLEKIKMVYETSTRGFFKSITIENKKFLVTETLDGKPNEITLTKAEWKSIAVLFKKVDLATYNTLEGTTKERHYDKRAHANLTIEKEEVKYETLGFDHEIPPTQIKGLVEMILKLSDKK